MRDIVRDRRFLIGAAAAATLTVVVLMVIALFPWGVLQGQIERGLSHRFGAPVRIGRLERVDTIGFVPMLEAAEVVIPQPRWAGSGNLVEVRRLRLSFAAFPMLLGRFRPHDLVIDGLRLSLVRRADGRANWQRDGDGGGDGGRLDLAGLTIRDSILSYRDAKRDRRAILRVAAGAAGVTARGQGSIAGVQVKIAVTGAAVTLGRQWPFNAQIDGGALALSVRGTMERPLDTRHTRFAFTTRADDLKLVDAVIEAGLFGTQPVRLSADVRREGDRWSIRNLAGTIGTSQLAGQLDVVKRGGRTRLDGAVDAKQLDFDDFASDAGLAQAAAVERAEGLKLVPNTRLNLAKIDKTDGRITVRVRRIFSKRRPSSLVWARGVIELDHQRLRAPLTIGLKRGTIAGTIMVDQGGRPEPRIAIDLRLRGSSIDALAGGGGSVTGRVDGHVVLAGRGSTIREAVGNGDGRIGLVARDGQLPAEIAAALGFDAGRALIAGDDDRAALRCAIVGLDVTKGTGRAAPFIVDTSQSRLDGTGTISFPSEALALRLSGAPKRNSIFRLPGNAMMAGTIRVPDLEVPRDVKSVGNVFKAIGRAITGRQGPTATDADCVGLAARVLR